MFLSRLQQFRFDWKLSLLVLLLLPLLLRLGFWQLAREQEKLALQQSYSERQSRQPVPLATLDPAADLQYRQARAVGRYDNEHVFLLDNRIFRGRVGYEVLQPFVLPDGTTVLVNRGWIAQGENRQQRPEPPLLQGERELSGSIYVPVGEQLILGDIAPGDEWPKLVQRVDVAELAELAGLDRSRLFPYSLRLGEGADGVLERNWSVISTSPEKHRGYAVQWFTMATVLVLLYLYYSTRGDNPGNEATSERKEQKKEQKERKDK